MECSGRTQWISLTRTEDNGGNGLCADRSADSGIAPDPAMFAWSKEGSGSVKGIRARVAVKQAVKCRKGAKRHTSSQPLIGYP